MEVVWMIIDLNGFFKKKLLSRGYSIFSVKFDKNEK